MTARQIEVRLAWLSLMLALVTLGALALIDLHLRNAVSPQGIVSFELCAYTGRCRAIVEAWGPSGQVWAALSVGLDYLFMLAYAAAIFLALRLVAARVPERLKKFTLGAAWAVWGAGAADTQRSRAVRRLQRVSGDTPRSRIARASERLLEDTLVANPWALALGSRPRDGPRGDLRHPHAARRRFETVPGKHLRPAGVARSQVRDGPLRQLWKVRVTSRVGVDLLYGSVV